MTTVAEISAAENLQMVHRNLEPIAQVIAAAQPD
jgi:hypothetical protein